MPMSSEVREEHESSLIEKNYRDEQHQTAQQQQHIVNNNERTSTEEKENFSDYYVQVQFHHEVYAHARFNVK